MGFFCQWLMFLLSNLFLEALAEVFIAFVRTLFHEEFVPFGDFTVFRIAFICDDNRIENFKKETKMFAMVNRLGN
jgi:hypothetical protein